MTGLSKSMKKILFGVVPIVFLFAILAIPLYGKGNDNQSSTKAVLGLVEHVRGNTLVVDDKKEGTMEAEIDKKTKFIGNGKRLLRLSNIKPKDIVAIVGSESERFATNGAKLKQALKVFVKEGSSSAQLKRRAIYGVIQAINASSITLVHPIHQERTFTLLVDDKTRIKMKGNDHATLSDLKVGMRIAAVGELNNQGALVAKLIHVIPGLAKGIFNKHPLATPSATLTATPTATLTPSITASPSVTLSPSPTATSSPTP